MMFARKPIAGFTLLEVLVALVILSLGLLGLATLQLTGLRNTSNAYYRTQASILANNMVERIHANTGGAYQAAAAPPCTTLPNPYCARFPSTAAASCNVAQMATHDIFVVACGDRQNGTDTIGGINDLLPNGTLQIDGPLVGSDPCAAESQCQVIIGWTEADEDEDGNLDDKNVTVVFLP